MDLPRRFTFALQVSSGTSTRNISTFYRSYFSQHIYCRPRINLLQHLFLSKDYVPHIYNCRKGVPCNKDHYISCPGFMLFRRTAKHTRVVLSNKERHPEADVHDGIFLILVLMATRKIPTYICSQGRNPVLFCMKENPMLIFTRGGLFWQ